jgi:hypothetical protein
MKYLALALVLTACGTDDTDVAGDYQTNITNGDNGCNFGGWTVGAVTATAVTVTQSGRDVTATVTGVAALALEAAVGGHVYSGKVSGDSLSLKLFGTRSNTTGNCTYTFNSEIHAEVHGDALTGKIDYVAATNGNPDCSGVTGCQSSQEFSGARPPR